MSSEQLRHELELLRAQIEALQPTNAAEQYLAQIFAEPKFAPHLPAIIAHLCGETPVYSFDVEADPDEAGHLAHYTALWYDRSQSPIVIQYTRRWREMPQDRDDAPHAPEAAAGMEDDTLAPLALSESAQTSAQGHSAQPATPASSDRLKPTVNPSGEGFRTTAADLTAKIGVSTPTVERSAEEIAAERARIEARIAELEQRLQAQGSERPRWRPSVVEYQQPEGQQTLATPRSHPLEGGKVF